MEGDTNLGARSVPVECGKVDMLNLLDL